MRFMVWTDGQPVNDGAGLAGKFNDSKEIYPGFHTQKYDIMREKL